MRFFFVAILFFGAVGLFAGLARYSHKEGVEQELKDKSLAVLQEAGFKDVTVSFDHMVADLAGFVDSEEERTKVLPLLEKSVPGAYFPEKDNFQVQIRPTLAPWVHMTKPNNSLTAKLEGSISSKEEAAKRLLGARLHSVSGGNAIANEIELDARRLPLEPVAEFASLAAGLISSSQASELILKDGVLTIRAEVDNAGIKFGLMEIAKSIAGASVVDEVSVKATRVFANPSEMHLRKSRFGVVIEGKVPDDRVKEKIKEAFTSQPGLVRLNGDLEVDPDLEAPYWLNNALTLIPLFIDEMEGGAEVHYAGDRVLVKGQVSTEAQQGAIVGVLGKLAKSETSVDVIAEVTLTTEMTKEQVQPEIAAEFKGGKLTLKGILPSEEVVASLVSEISSNHPDVEIENQIQIVALTIQEEWLEKLGGFLSEVMERTNFGETSIRNGKVELAGEALTVEQTRFLHNLAVNTVPTTFTILNTLKFEEIYVPVPSLEPEAEVALLKELEKLPVYFKSGSDAVGNDEMDKLKTAADLIKKTGVAFPFEVGGLSDTLGNPEKNRLLSIKRASSVRAALVSLGIAEDRISAVSFGVDQVNTSSKSRWKARRVEITIAKSENAKKEDGAE